MHALGIYLQEQMDARGWGVSDLAHRAQLPRQQVWKLVNTDRKQLGKRLAPHTIEGLAEALEEPESELERRMWEALGAPVERGRPVAVTDTPDAVLIEIFRRRLELGDKAWPDDQLLRVIRERLKR